MKKLTLLLALLVTTNSFAALPTSVMDFEISAPIYKGGLEWAATLLFVKSTAPELDYAEAFPSLVPSIGGNNLNVEPSHHFGFQAMIGYIFPCSNMDMKFTYTDFNTEDNNKINAMEGFLIPSLSFPGTAFPTVLLGAVVEDFTIEFGPNTTSVPVQLLNPTTLTISPNFTEASIKEVFNYRSVDFDVGQYANVDNFMRLRWFGGVRYAHIKHEFDAIYAGTPFATDTQTVTTGFSLFPGPVSFTMTTVSTITFTATGSILETVQQSTNFRGIGPRVGFEGSFHLGGGFGLVGNISTALLFGNKDSAISEILNADFDLLFTSLDTVITNITPPDNVDSITPDPTTITIGGVPATIGETIIPLDNESRANDYDYPDVTLVVPNIEAKLGFDYTWRLKNCATLSMELGYFISHYFNVIDRLSDLTAPQNGATIRHTIDASFSGPYFTLTVTL